MFLCGNLEVVGYWKLGDVLVFLYLRVEWSFSMLDNCELGWMDIFGGNGGLLLLHRI